MQSSVYIINKTMLFFSFNKNQSKLWTSERTYKFRYFDRSLSKKKNSFANMKWWVNLKSFQIITRKSKPVCTETSKRHLILHKFKSYAVSLMVLVCSAFWRSPMFQLHKKSSLFSLVNKTENSYKNIIYSWEPKNGY